MQDERRQIFEAIGQYAPVPWELIPDLGLYMDQVITFITRMYEPLYGEAASGYLSPSMINNYVKCRLLPHPEGKKYSREQIALLAMIVALKQVATMEDIRAMLTLPEGETVRSLYARFCRRQKAVIASLENLPENSEELPPAMDFAIMASGYRAGFEAMLRPARNP